MARREEYTSPLGKIILARAEALGARRGPGVPAKPLSLSEMATLTNGRLTRAAISEWILGRVKNPTPELLDALAIALAEDWDYPKVALLADMRAAVGLPRESTLHTLDVTELTTADVEVLQLVADRFREARREGAAAAAAATERATSFAKGARPLSRTGHHNGDGAFAGR